MIRPFLLAIRDLADPRLLGILVRSLTVTLLLFALFGLLLLWALQGVDPCAWFGDMTCALGPTGSSLGAILLAALALWLLFPAVALGVISSYMDQVISLVEAKHYPDAALKTRGLGLLAGALLGLRSVLRLLVYNLIALPLYAILLVTGVGTILAFLLVNGLAFGRDLGEMVAARHGDRASRSAWLRGSRGDRALVGIVITALFMLPLLNLLAPLLGATMITHAFHADRKQPRGGF